MLAKGNFTARHIDALRKAYANHTRVPVDFLPRFRAVLAQCNDRQLARLARAKIRFLSALAVNEQVRREAMVDAVADAVVAESPEIPCPPRPRAVPRSEGTRSPGYPGPCPEGMSQSAWLAFNNVD